mgnify:CR=1 FL=1
MTNIEILQKYTAGEMTLEQANAELSGIKLNPGKNILTEEEKRATTVGYYPDQANGWGLLDTGTGSLDKVEVRGGKLVKAAQGEAFALCIIAGKSYEVKDDTLVEG